MNLSQAGKAPLDDAPLSDGWVGRALAVWLRGLDPPGSRTHSALPRPSAAVAVSEIHDILSINNWKPSDISNLRTQRLGPAIYPAAVLSDLSRYVLRRSTYRLRPSLCGGTTSTRIAAETRRQPAN